ncbi:MAG: Caspase domain-containing protein [Spirulinaceae cyanobacterium SM2_1_0]|nr:Caspase domain-containing protein [Spirulinaceae cyanobacterium SM2_1_0]
MSCAASESQVLAPPPEPTPTVAAAVATPVARANAFQDALDIGMGAATLAQSARTENDWRLVAGQWQRAIALLTALPPTAPQHQAAQAKIAEYQQNLATAQQRSGAEPSSATTANVPAPTASPIAAAASGGAGMNFLVVAGGGTPRNNEIALEKNVLYFQRALQARGFDPAQATIFFANGNDGQATVRYINDQRQEQYKAPAIPGVAGAATVANVTNWLGQQGRDRRSLFFYFTGHGAKNNQNPDNNSLILWGDQRLTVQQLSQQLDQLGSDRQIVTMMAQCYAGSFANFVHPNGTPGVNLAAQTRCGFFATIKTSVSVGCTPEVNEADYRDYSSSFFAGLSGRDRTGQAAASADYNRDGRVSYAEAHGFAKVDGRTTDLPVSTSEVWLHSQRSEAEKQQILNQPLQSLLASARPEQRYVVETLARQFGMNLNQSYQTQATNRGNLGTVQSAYLTRLGMELLNIGIEQQLRASGNSTLIAILQRLLECEATTWQ